MAQREIRKARRPFVVLDRDGTAIEMGRAGGALTFLVRTGYGARFGKAAAAGSVVDELAAAAEPLGKEYGGCATEARRTRKLRKFSMISAAGAGFQKHA